MRRTAKIRNGVSKVRLLCNTFGHYFWVNEVLEGLSTVTLDLSRITSKQAVESQQLARRLKR